MLQILFPSLNEGKNYKIFLGLQLPQDSNCIWNKTYFPMPCFAWVLPNMKYFPNHRSLQIFFTSAIGPDILMNVLEDYIILLLWTAWVLFDFYREQKQRFSVYSFTNYASFISFHEGLWSTYIHK